MNNELYNNILKLLEPFKDLLLKIATIVIIGTLITFVVVVLREHIKRFLSRLSHRIKTRETPSRPHKY